MTSEGKMIKANAQKLGDHENKENDRGGQCNY